MSKKGCKHCRHFKIHGTNGVCTEFCNESTIHDSCEHFEEPTLFDRITESPEVLAEKLVYYLRYGNCYASCIISDVFKTKAEAIAATVAKLKEVGE